MPTTTTLARIMYHFMPESIHIFRSRCYDNYNQDIHLPTCPINRDKVEVELTLNIKKAISPEESAPKQNMSTVSSKLYSGLGTALSMHTNHLSDH